MQDIPRQFFGNRRGSLASTTIFKNRRESAWQLQRFSETLFQAMFLAYFPRTCFKNDHENSVMKYAFCSSVWNDVVVAW